MELKEEVLDLAKKLYHNHLTPEMGTNLLLNLITNEFVLVSEVKPPYNIEILAKSPEGVIHLANWRSAYNIFSCQCKGESTCNWYWKNI